MIGRGGLFLAPVPLSTLLQLTHGQSFFQRKRSYASQDHGTQYIGPTSGSSF